jgi:metal-dependent amidase/aminoacylase/carboxypeptidase family protein
MGSTDFGNVSQALPGIHPYISIASEDTAGHSVEFRAASNSPAGHEGLMSAAKALAMTAIDLLAQPETMAAAKREFAAARGLTAP